MADKNFKKDPDVIAHVETQVSKAAVAATKAERARVLAHLKTAGEGNKTEENKVIKTATTDLLKILTALIKAGE